MCQPCCVKIPSRTGARQAWLPSKMADKVARIVHARNLGRIAYLPCLSIQNDTAREHLEYLASRRLNPSRNTLLFCEHNPVYTIGIRNKSVTDEEKFRLRALGAEFHHTNRGGLITFHGPGQLVCYPILNLACFKKSVRWYVARLEETLIATCKTFGVEARTTADTGVWVGNNKIAAIGQCPLCGSVYGRFATKQLCARRSRKILIIV